MAASVEGKKLTEELATTVGTVVKKDERYYFNLWKQTNYFNRCNQLYKRRTGIDIHEAASRNYDALVTRVCTLTTPMSTSMKQHLSTSLRNEMGLTAAEQIMYHRLFHSDWYLIHRCDGSVLEKIRRSAKPELLSLEELQRRNIEPGGTLTGHVDELVDSIFFSVAVGPTEGRGWGCLIGKTQFTIHLNNVDPTLLQGAFLSGALNRFHQSNKLESTKRVLYGTLCYNKHTQIFDGVEGHKFSRQYYFVQPDGEVIVESMDRREEFFDLSKLRHALTYRMIERIRQLGLNAWIKIYNNIDTFLMDEIYELVKNIFDTDVLEAHLPRALNIRQPSVNIQEAAEIVEADNLKHDSAITQRIIIAAYEGDLAFLKSFSAEQLQKSVGILGDHIVDVISAAILGGQTKVIDFVLLTGLSLEGFTETTEKSTEYDIGYKYHNRPEMIVRALVAVMGLSSNNPLPEALVCPKKLKEERQNLANGILDRLVLAGTHNPVNRNITYPLVASYVHIDLDNSEDRYNPGIETEFCGKLMKMGCKFDSPIFETDITTMIGNAGSMLTKCTFIFQGQDPCTQRSWYLLDDATRNSFLFGFRSDKTVLKPLDLDLEVERDGKSVSEVALLNKAASAYYALPPRAVELLARSERPESGIILFARIVDLQQNERLMKEFSDNIVFDDSVQTKKALSAHLKDEKPTDVVMCYLFKTFSAKKEVQTQLLQFDGIRRETYERSKLGL